MPIFLENADRYSVSGRTLNLHRAANGGKPAKLPVSVDFNIACEETDEDVYLTQFGNARSRSSVL